MHADDMDQYYDFYGCFVLPLEEGTVGTQVVTEQVEGSLPTELRSRDCVCQETCILR